MIIYYLKKVFFLFWSKSEYKCSFQWKIAKNQFQDVEIHIHDIEYPKPISSQYIFFYALLSICLLISQYFKFYHDKLDRI